MLRTTSVIDLSVKVTIMCKVCYNTLGVTAVSVQGNNNYTFIVEPCNYCMDQISEIEKQLIKKGND